MGRFCSARTSRWPMRSIGAEKVSKQFRTIALPTAMKQNDMSGQREPLLLRLIENLPNRIQRLGVGKMPSASHDSPLQKRRAFAVQLHLWVVIALDRQNIDAAESPDQFRTGVAQIRRISDPAAESFDDESMRTEFIVREPDRSAVQFRLWVKTVFR